MAKEINLNEEVKETKVEETKVEVKKGSGKKAAGKSSTKKEENKDPMSAITPELLAMLKEQVKKEMIEECGLTSEKKVEITPDTLHYLRFVGNSKFTDKAGKVWTKYQDSNDLTIKHSDLQERNDLLFMIEYGEIQDKILGELLWLLRESLIS